MSRAEDRRPGHAPPNGASGRPPVRPPDKTPAGSSDQVSAQSGDQLGNRPPGQPPARAPDGARPAWFRQVTFYSLLAGLCPLIPVPFLDDRVLAGVRRKMVRELAEEGGLTGARRLDRTRVDLLAGTAGESRGCLGWVGWLAFTLTVRLLAKLFKKILLFFAVKESVDTASRVFHEGYLLHLTFSWAPAWAAAEAGAPGGGGLDPGRARAVRRTLEATLDDVDPRPLEQTLRRTFRGSRRLLRRGARLLTRRGAREAGRQDRGTERALPEDEEKRLLARVLDGLVADLWEERGYLAALEQRYRRQLAAAPADGSGPEIGPDAGPGMSSGSGSDAGPARTSS